MKSQPNLKRASLGFLIILVTVMFTLSSFTNPVNIHVSNFKGVQNNTILQGNYPHSVNYVNSAQNSNDNTNIPVWAFSGAYTNYTIEYQNKSGNFTGFSMSKINTLYYNSNGSVFLFNITTEQKLGNYTQFSTENLSWYDLLYSSFLLNGSELSELNNGTDPFDYNATVQTDQSLETSLGTFNTDALNSTAFNSNGSFHSKFEMFIDTYAGVDLEYRYSNDNYSLSSILNTTNIPLSATQSGYEVTFAGYGLPGGYSWAVSFNGITSGTEVFETPSNISFHVQSGNYNFSIVNVNGYTADPSSGSIDVTGSVLMNITFSANPYPLWAFKGAYLNYTYRAKNSTASVYGYTVFKIDYVNYQYRYVNWTLISTEYNGSLTKIEEYNFTDIPWSTFNVAPPFVINITMLSDLNHGIMPLSYATLNAPIRTFINLSTPMGVVVADALNFHYNSVELSHLGNISIYIDTYSGVTIAKTIESKSGNETSQLQSTNIPLASASSTLDLSVSPSGSSVLVNGIPVALSSGHANLSLTPGTYYVSASDYGYSPYFREVNISSGKVTYLNITLSRSTESTYFLSGYVTPGNASVVVGDIIAHVSPSGYYNTSLPAGNYTISVSDSGYYPAVKTIDLKGNITGENVTLTREPAPTSSKSVANVTATGYNVTVSNLTSGNGTISLDYTSAPNGTVTVVIPYSQMGNVTVSEILNSRVYVNGTRYTDFTVAISSQDGTYSVILTVNNLSGDPALVWLYSPSASLPTGQKSSPPLPAYVLDIGVIIVLAAIASALVLVARRRKR